MPFMIALSLALCLLTMLIGLGPVMGSLALALFLVGVALFLTYHAVAQRRHAKRKVKNFEAILAGITETNSFIDPTDYENSAAIPF